MSIWMNNGSYSQIEAGWHKQYDVDGTYLVSLHTDLVSPRGFARDEHGFSMDCTPQTRAVVGDFGDLTIVRGWM